MGAAGFTAAGFAGACAPGLVPGAPGGFCAGGGDCATNVSTSASKQAEAINDVFIVLLNQDVIERLRYRSVFIAKSLLVSPAKVFTFLIPRMYPLLRNITTERM
jgi:hypothetical protein